jgi:hypothetical protein
VKVPYVGKNFWSSRSCKTKALKPYGAACQIITELSKTSLIAVIILFAKCYLWEWFSLLNNRYSWLNLIFPMVTHFTRFEKVTLFSRSARPKVRTEENIETLKRGRRTPIISQATVAADWVISVNLLKDCSKGSWRFSNSWKILEQHSWCFHNQLQLAQGYFQ